MLKDPVRIGDLFPTAKVLFDRTGKRRWTAALWFAWAAAAALALLLGRRALRWMDRNL